ncbi:MAG: hypothetical protein QMD01_01290 [Thermodesulfovibrionales bacterium]|nr:hypothetical protein [Thermodesulfovibrionales bacterium]
MKKSMFLIKCSFVALITINLILPIEAVAVPAAPFLHTLMQPEGLKFKARQWGDERLHGWETEDGYTIMLDKNTRRWTYATREPSGQIISSEMIVGTDVPSADLIKRIRPAKQKTEDQQTEDKKNAPLMVPPAAGTNNIAVILINFTDTTPQYTPADFNTLLFGAGNNSLKDYYNEVSYGAIALSAGPSGITGWHTASNTHDYYGGNIGDMNGEDAWP